jgi:hypothetical protein
MLNPAGILADQPSTHLVQRGLDRQTPALQRGLAQTAEAVVGMEPDH